MGGLQSLPSFDLKLSSNCCNGKAKDDLDGSKKPGKFSRSRKIDESSSKIKKKDPKMVIEPVGVQSEQADVEEISNESV